METKKWALIVCNAKSGHQKGLKKINKIKNGLSDIYNIDTYISEYPKSVTDKIKNEGESYDAIITMGGDGTIHEAINGVMYLEKKPKLAFIPMGTCNDVCHTYGYKNIKTVIKRIREDKEISVDLTKMNECYYIYTFATGSVASVTYENDPTKKILGKMFYYLRAMAKIFKKSCFTYKIGDKQSNAYLFIALNSIHMGGFWLRGQKLNDGKIHLYVCAYRHALRPLFAFAFLMVFKKKSKIIKLYEEEELHITFNEKQPINVDGEYYGQEDFIDLKIAPKAIKIF
jgi:YegS/Rv2252/BmrU family lipid kinase